MKKIILLCLLSTSVISQTSNIFKPIDVFDLEYVSNTEISPNGNKVLYQRNFNDIMTDESFSNIWIINYDGTDNRPITAGNYKDNSPKWSNKGDKFIFKSNREGKSQIFLFDLNNTPNDNLEVYNDETQDNTFETELEPLNNEKQIPNQMKTQISSIDQNVEPKLAVEIDQGIGESD